MLEVNGWSKMSEEDNWENGCSLDATFFSGNDRFAAETQDELIQKLMDFSGADDRENVLINSCDDLGRIDIQVYENEYAYPASKAEMERFKLNDARIWLSTYSFYAEWVTRKVAVLED